MGQIFEDLYPGETVDAGIRVMGKFHGAHKKSVCLRFIGEGSEGGGCQLDGDRCNDIIVLLHTRKVGLREVCVDRCQGGRGVRCGFIG